jgi:hypothetical protein
MPATDPCLSAAGFPFNDSRVHDSDQRFTSVLPKRLVVVGRRHRRSKPHVRRTEWMSISWTAAGRSRFSTVNSRALAEAMTLGGLTFHWNEQAATCRDRGHPPHPV